MAQYGISYKGSKDKIIHKIATLFPKADNFYDLFGGGFSVSHFMLLHRTHHVHYNELQPGNADLIRDAIAGRYNYDAFKPEWVTRDMFNTRKATCPYTRIIWSFGNNQRTYIFGEDIAPYKRSLHQAVVFNEFDDTAHEVLGFSSFPAHLSIRGRRLVACGKIRSEAKRIDLEQLERLQRLQQLEQLERLPERLTMTSLSYEQVPILPNSVIYCDPPYKGTTGYVTDFDHDRFWAWVRKQTVPVFVSEYSAPPDMKTVMAFRHVKTNSQTSTQSVEKVFTFEAQRQV